MCYAIIVLRNCVLRNNRHQAYRHHFIRFYFTDTFKAHPTLLCVDCTFFIFCGHTFLKGTSGLTYDRPALLFLYLVNFDKNWK